jgi:protease-4
MTTPADYMVDRRRLRRKLSLWRIAAIGAGLVAVLALAARVTGVDGTDKSSPHVARLAVEGVITGDAETLELVKDLASSKATAVLLSIDSPGGTTTGSEMLHNELRKLAKKKPVVAVVRNVAASGAYIAAIGADRIFVQGNSLIGSIGVLAEVRSLYKGLDMLGLKVEEIKSTPLKNAPNEFEPTSDAARAAMAALIEDSYGWFKGLVKERRNLTEAELAKVSDGRVFTGRQAIPLKLADAFGGETEAIEWLETEKGVAKKLPIRDWKKKTTFDRAGLFSLASAGASAAGLPILAKILDDAEWRRPNLDGLLAIWQGPSGY